MKPAKGANPPKQSVKGMFPAKSAGNRLPATDPNYKDGKRGSKMKAGTKC